MIRHFTLIELIIVIFVIGILLSMLIPVIVKARSKSLVTRCGSNLRQSGMFINMYAMDHDEWLPTSSIRLIDSEPNDIPLGVVSDLSDYGMLTRYWVCGKEYRENGDLEVEFWRNITYGKGSMSWWIPRTLSNGSIYLEGNISRLNRYEGEWVIMSDSVFRYASGYGPVGYHNNRGTIGYDLMVESANELFQDGHVELRSREQLSPDDKANRPNIHYK